MAPAKAGAMRITSGIYTGNGTSQSISGLVGAPIAVIIKSKTTADAMCMTISGMGADKTKDVDLANPTTFTGGVTSLDATGFSVGADARVNTNAVVYRYIAVIDNGVSDLKYGTYTGDGAGSKAITGIGFSSAMVIVLSLGADNAWWKSSAMAATVALPFRADSSNTTMITAIGADGFTAGASLNTNTRVYGYICLKASALFSVGSYAGDGLDNKGITGAGFGIQPTNGWTKNQSQTWEMALRFQNASGDASNTTQLSEGADRIQAFASDGFQVGQAQQVNNNGITYQTVFWLDGATVGGGSSKGGGGGRGGGRGGGAGQGGGNSGGGGTNTDKSVFVSTHNRRLRGGF